MTAVLVSTVVACGDIGGASTARSQAARSGEELFRGLAFRDGPVADLVAELGGRTRFRAATPERQEARERTLARVIADMHTANPAFFERYGADIQSGNHLRIEKAMRASAVLMRRVISKRTLAELNAGSGPYAGASTDSDNTDTANTFYANTTYGNTSFCNSEVGNTEWQNTDSDNTASNNHDYHNTEYDNASLGNTDHYNNIYDNTESGNYEWDQTEFGGGDESTWSGPHLARDQFIEMIATRLSIK